MKLFRKTEKICQKLDNASLWWTGFLLLAAAFFPYVLLGEGSVFRIHDQLDESLMNYVLPARTPVGWKRQTAGAAGRHQCQWNAALGISVCTPLRSAAGFLCFSGGICDCVFECISGDVFSGKGTDGQQYSGGCQRRLLCHASLLRGLRVKSGGAAAFALCSHLSLPEKA